MGLQFSTAFTGSLRRGEAFGIGVESVLTDGGGERIDMAAGWGVAGFEEELKRSCSCAFLMSCLATGAFGRQDSKNLFYSDQRKVCVSVGFTRVRQRHLVRLAPPAQIPPALAQHEPRPSRRLPLSPTLSPQLPRHTSNPAVPSQSTQPTTMSDELPKTPKSKEPCNVCKTNLEFLDTGRCRSCEDIEKEKRGFSKDYPKDIDVDGYHYNWCPGIGRYYGH